MEDGVGKGRPNLYHSSASQRPPRATRLGHLATDPRFGGTNGVSGQDVWTSGMRKNSRTAGLPREMLPCLLGGHRVGSSGEVGKWDEVKFGSFADAGYHVMSAFEMLGTMEEGGVECVLVTSITEIRRQFSFQHLIPDPLTPRWLSCFSNCNAERRFAFYA